MSKRRAVLCALFTLFTAGSVLADVSIIEHRVSQRVSSGKDKPEHGHRGRKVSGGISLVDSGGLQYFFNTNVLSTTSSSASGAASDATYTAAVNATTSAGGGVSTTLSDAFDGYNTLCVSLTGALTQCSTGDPSFAIYNQTGAPPATECGARQLVYPAQAIGGLSVSRKVFVPANDQFARWLNLFTNTTGAPITFSMVTANNLGSDSSTKIVSSSNGNATAELTDTWVSTFQSYSGSTSSDPRLGHVLQGLGATVPLALIHFADGEDTPYWGYTITLSPGETKIIASFVTGQPSKAAANAKAAQIAGLPDTTLQCLAGNERQQIANFAPPQNVVEVPALGELGFAILAVALTAAGLLVLRRRSAAA